MGPLLDRLPPRLQQVVHFGMVGALGFLVDVGGFNLLRFAGGEGPLHDYPLTAKVVSGAAATVTSWLGNRYLTFRHTRRAKAHHEFLLFAVMASIGTLIAMACLWVSHYGLDLRSPLADNVAANGVGLALAMAFRFWAYRRHVFSEEGDGSGLDRLAEDTAEDLAGDTAEDTAEDLAGDTDRDAPSVSRPA